MIINKSTKEKELESLAYSLPTAPIKLQSTPLIDSKDSKVGVVNNSDSSIKKAAFAKTFEPSKPTLEKPDLCPQLMLINLNKSLKRTSNRISSLSARRLEENNAAIEKLSSEHLEKMQKNASELKSAKSWGLLQEMSSLIWSLFSIGSGAALVYSGGGAVTGTALITSGCLSILNTALSRTDGWESIAEKLSGDSPERKKQIASLLPMITNVVVLGLNILALAQTDVAEVLHRVEGDNLDILGFTPAKFLDFLTKAGTLVSITGNGVTAVSTFRINNSEANLKTVENDLVLKEKEAGLLANTIEAMIKEFERISATIKRTIKESNEIARAVTAS